MCDPQTYTVGWICATDKEFSAARAFLDEIHDDPTAVSVNDNNAYVLGRIGKHNVVIAVAPDGEYGTQSAATVARDMLHSFPNVRIGLMVGVAGGVPSSEHDIRLGDVVVSTPRDGKGGVFQYDFGKERQNQNFQATGFLNQPPPLLRAAVTALKAQYDGDGHNLQEAVSKALENKPRLRRSHGRPDPRTDMLYLPSVVHSIEDDGTCVEVCGDDSSKLVPRDHRSKDEDDPAIHYGLIASANRVMKNAMSREAAARQGILCFEMEAAGLMNHFPCIVIRGICDYSDSHKNKDWQGYAAMVAAAYTKDLLLRIAPNRVEAEKPIAQTLDEVKKDVKIIEKHVENLVLGQRSREDEEILQWLTSKEYTSQQQNFISKCQPGTGKWFLDSEEFQAWQKATRQTLFCHGIPGAGKTFLTSIVINRFQRHYKVEDKTNIAYLYCDFRQREQQELQSACGLLASIVKQLARGYPSLPAAVRELYRTHRNRGTRPVQEDLITVLRAIITPALKTFIIIDAVDELSEACRTDLLHSVFQLQTKIDLNIFITSRPILDIKREFQKCKCYVSVKIHARDEDVQSYLQSRMSELRISVSEDIQKQIIHDITEAAGGMFLLVQLYFGLLYDKVTITKIKNTLVDLKQEAEERSSRDDKLAALTTAYSHTMERVNGQPPGLRELANEVLCWVTHARRPLTSSELRCGLSITVDKLDLDDEDQPDVDIIISVCHGLVTIDEQSEVIRLVHFTTYEYLDQHHKVLQGPKIHDPETYLAQRCITYLCLADLDPEQSKKSLRSILVSYVMAYWPDHYRCAVQHHPDLESQVERFIRQPHSDFKIYLIRASRKWIGDTRSRKGAQLGREILCAFVKDVTQVLQNTRTKLTSGALVELFNGLSMYLHLLNWACLYQEDKKKNSLLNQVFDLRYDEDRMDFSEEQTLLAYAVSAELLAETKLLLEHGADPNIDCRLTATQIDIWAPYCEYTLFPPLIIAVERNNAALVNLLLEFGADVNILRRVDGSSINGPFGVNRSALSIALADNKKSDLVLIIKQAGGKAV